MLDMTTRTHDFYLRSKAHRLTSDTYFYVAKVTSSGDFNGMWPVTHGVAYSASCMI